MDLSDAVSRHERGNAILFTRDSPCLSALRSLLESSLPLRTALASRIIGQAHGRAMGTGEGGTHG